MRVLPGKNESVHSEASKSRLTGDVSSRICAVDV